MEDDVFVLRDTAGGRQSVYRQNEDGKQSKHVKKEDREGGDIAGVV